MQGCTTYRPNDVTGSVLSVSESSEAAPEADQGADVIYWPNTGSAPSVRGQYYKLKWPDSEHAIYVTVNDVIINDHRRPFEVFINPKIWKFGMDRG